MDSGDCSECTGLFMYLPSAMQCVEQRPEFSYEMCGFEEYKNTPPRNCDKRMVHLMDCMSSCVTKVGLVPTEAAAYGECMARDFCGTMECKATCDCVLPGQKCKQPCYRNCLRYEDCIVDGGGAESNDAYQWKAYVDQCVLNKPLPTRAPSNSYNNTAPARKVKCWCAKNAPDPKKKR